EATAPLFAEYGVASQVEPVGTPAAAAALLDRVRPRALICGTSRYVGAERILTVAARTRSLPSIAVLDQWFQYRSRFADAAGGLQFLTDLICCPDQMAREEAVREGLPPARLLVSGSPSLASLAAAIAQFAADPWRPPDIWACDDATRRILFLSE